MENKYCFLCGSNKLTDNFYCLDCECHSKSGLQERLESRGPCITIEYITNYSKSSHYADRQTEINCCHTCKYFMWHSLQWCPGCGQKQVKELIKWNELQNKYPDYRVGY